MTKARRTKPSGNEDQLRSLQQAVADAQAILRPAVERLDDAIDDEQFASETPVEVTSAMTLASESIREALRILRDGALEATPAPRPQGSRRPSR